MCMEALHSLKGVITGPLEKCTNKIGNFHTWVTKEDKKGGGRKP